MGLKCGIVGLPNVGKSTLFNALSSDTLAEAADYPFCTIEPNHSVVPIPDPRLSALSAIVNAAKVIPESLEIIDIAGLVQGASKGEGLGNRFLGHIREVDALLHVVGCFRNADPKTVVRAIETVETEFLLADLGTIERFLSQKKQHPPEKLAAAREVHQRLAAGQPAQHPDFDLLSSKPVLYICNVDEASCATGHPSALAVADLAQQHGHGCTVISAAIEAEISRLPTKEERQEFLQTLGLSVSGLEAVIDQSFALLNLIRFYTAGPKEARAWRLVKGQTAATAAGRIHSDMEKGFIRAEIIAFDDFIACQGEQGARQHGRLRVEGRHYPIQDGDVCHFLFNV